MSDDSIFFWFCVIPFTLFVIYSGMVHSLGGLKWPEETEDE